MQLLDDVYKNYRGTVAKGGPVRSANTTPDLAAVRQGLPDFFRSVVAATGRDAEAYRFYGSVGQLNWKFAKIPWVAICDRRVSTSTERGYYIVLLLREDMKGCVLSLNQGVTQFEDAFRTKGLALGQIEASARRCLLFLETKEQFTRGRISLGATGDLGRGYERGAIISKVYPAEPLPDESTLASDTGHLLDLYDRLIERVGPHLALQVAVGEDAFQRAVGSIARGNREISEPPAGPLPPPPFVGGAGSNRYRRDPNISALAQRRAGFRCEVDRQHLTFTSRVSKANFVESHHLIPMARQAEFSASLDVAENVVALCPTCHRLLHHGLVAQKKPILRELVAARAASLEARGIPVRADSLVGMYRGTIEDED